MFETILFEDKLEAQESYYLVLSFLFKLEERYREYLLELRLLLLLFRHMLLLFYLEIRYIFLIRPS